MENTRNFCILAHIDHGKSTLADRLIEKTGTVKPEKMRGQLLDQMDIERERGITIKLAPVRMEYQGYILNLIDTPGHVDFAYEVSRSLAACEGAILLIDATQGIQAQTLAHFHACQKLGLTLIPAINKIDVTTADVAGTKHQIQNILNINPDTTLLVSGKTGAGVPELIQAVIDLIPPPVASPDPSQTRALVFNSNFDSHLGVVAWIRVVDGEVNHHDKLFLLGTAVQAQAIEVGIFAPARKPKASLSA